MKKLKLPAVFLIAASILAPAAFAAKDREKGESIILPDTELLDIPTAGILDYYGFQVKTRAYSGGGVLTALNFGVLERLNLGTAMAVDKLIGSDSPIRMRRPEIQVKFRFFDGGYYIPAAALGYDGQGYYYDSVSKKYLEKGKGVYLAGSKEVGISNFVVHAGLNVPDFDNSYLFGFLGANYTLEDKVAFMLEFDNLFHSNDPSRFNAGVRVYVTPYFQLDLGVRELGAGRDFSNGLPRKAERVVQLRYNTNF
ncbi:MAG: hypothetical protein WCW52_11310 [Elusimicrobiales bacterium]|jgi:hypothetical protein